MKMFVLSPWPSHTIFSYPQITQCGVLLFTYIMSEEGEERASDVRDASNCLSSSSMPLNVALYSQGLLLNVLEVKKSDCLVLTHQ